MQGAGRLATMAFGLTLLARATSAQPLTSGAEAGREAVGEDRRSFLQSYVSAHVNRENWGEGVGYVEAALGVLLGLGGVGVLAEDKRAGATWIAASAISTATVAASLFASRDTRVDLLQVNTFFVIGSVALGLGIAEDPGSIPRLTSLSYAGAHFTYGALKAANLMSRRTPLHVMRQHGYRLHATNLSAGEFAKIERDFLGTYEPIPYEVMAAPLGIGAVVAFLPVLDPESSEAEETWSLVGSALLGLECVLSVMSVNLVPKYVDELGLAGLELMAGPTSVEAILRF